MSECRHTMLSKSKKLKSWRQDACEALKALKSELNSVCEYKAFCEYLELKEMGLRKQSLEKINEFVSLAEAFSDAKRRELVSLICFKKLGWLDSNQLIDSYILTNKIIIPTLKKWAKDEPKNPEPLKWLGLFYWGGNEVLEECLNLNPDDEVVRLIIITRYLDAICYSTHHLDEGVYIGDPLEDLDICNKIKKHLSFVSDKETRLLHESVLSEYIQVIEHYQAQCQ